ncbi:F-box associated ubiquitination effector family protein [Perilla frutescens var. frutescens]|nr:F-box associated ubiquitination effector family protein [Perilla frutescens var. frutescens]
MYEKFWILEKRGAVVVPSNRPDPTSESKVGSTLDLTRIAPSILLRIAVANQNTQQALALPEKEVIQPHLPVRLPCYDFTPVTSPAFGIPLLAVKVTTSGMANSHSVTGGVYKARERIHRRMVDRRLLAIPASCRRVAACNPN